MTEGAVAERNGKLLWVAAVAVACTRFAAISRSLWDWDEALFCLSLRHYDVSAHHPHPPGFPMYVAAAKLVHLFVHDEFRALQVVNLIAACLIFPLFLAMARAMRFSERTSLISALLFSFLPNVWFYGGTAFSDIPALAVMLASMAALFAGRRDRRWYFIGCLLFGAAMTFRPQNLIVGAWPLLLATWDRARERRSDVVIGAALAAAVVIAGYGGAAIVTGPKDYWNAFNAHRRYVMAVDSYHNPGRPPSWRLSKAFIVDPYGAGIVSFLMAALTGIGAIAAIVRRDRAAGHLALTFVPAMVFTIFMVNFTGTARHSLSYIAFTAIMTVIGAGAVAELLTRRFPNLTNLVFGAILLVVFGRLIVWTLPSLREVRDHDSPPVAALLWAKNHVPRSQAIDVYPGFAPHAEYLLAGVPNATILSGEGAAPRDPSSEPAWFIIDEPSDVPGAHVFRRPTDHLFRLFTQRDFEASVIPLTDTATFGEGWYAAEELGNRVWRWMGRRSVLMLPPAKGKGELTLDFYVPLDAEPPPNVLFSMNGTPIGRARPTTSVWQVQYVVDARGDAPNELVIEVDRAVRPARDARELGLRLSSWSWRAVQP